MKKVFLVAVNVALIIAMLSCSIYFLCNKDPERAKIAVIIFGAAFFLSNFYRFDSLDFLGVKATMLKAEQLRASLNAEVDQLEVSTQQVRSALAAAQEMLSQLAPDIGERLAEKHSRNVLAPLEFCASAFAYCAQLVETYGRDSEIYRWASFFIAKQIEDKLSGATPLPVVHVTSEIRDFCNGDTVMENRKVAEIEGQIDQTHRSHYWDEAVAIATRWGFLNFLDRSVWEARSQLVRTGEVLA